MSVSATKFQASPFAPKHPVPANAVTPAPKPTPSGPNSNLPLNYPQAVRKVIAEIQPDTPFADQIKKVQKVIRAIPRSQQS